MFNAKMMKKSSAIILTTMLLGSQIVTMIPASASANAVDKKMEMVQTPKNSVEVSTWKQLQDAYADSTVTSIKLTKDISYDTGALAVGRSTDFYIEGNGHKIDLGNQVFRVLQSATATFTIKNVPEIKTTASTVTGIVSSGDANVAASGWTINFENVKAADDNKTRIASVSGAQLNLSGKIEWPTSSELAVIDGVKIAENAKVTSYKQAVSEERSFFWFAGSNFTDAFTTKGSREFVVGKNATVNFKMENGSGIYPVVFAFYKQIHLESGATFNAKMPGNVFRADYYDSSFRADGNNEITMTSTGKIYSPVNFASGAKYNTSSEFYVGPQSNVEIKAEGGPLFQGTNASNAAKTKITFDNPEKYDLNNTKEGLTESSSVATDNFAEFSIKDADMSVWTVKDSAINPASYSVKDVDYVTQVQGGITTSSNSELASYFPTTNLRRITNIGIADIKETTINELTPNSTEVTGTGEPGATIVIKVDNTIIGSGSIDEDGNYSVQIEKQKAGTTVEAAATLNGQTSTASTVITGAEEDYSITADQFIVGHSTYLTGTVGSDVATVRVYVNGNVVNNITPKDGKFRAYVSAITSASDDVKVVSLDAEGNEKEEAKVPLVVQELVLTAKDYTIGESYITGDYDKEGTKVVLYIDGKVAKNSVLDPKTMTYKVAARDLVT
ncbi:hypothetical protein HCA69_15835, partial [Listeria grandensis]